MNEKFYKIYPEVSGSIIRKSSIDRTDNSFRVLALAYTFDGWLGDDIVTSLGCFIVSERLRQRLEEFSGTGYVFDKVRVAKSDKFKFSISQRPDAFPPLPKFHWLKVTGAAGQDDFGLQENWDMVVSEFALEVLRSCQLPIVKWKKFKSQKRYLNGFFNAFGLCCINHIGQASGIPNVVIWLRALILSIVSVS